MLAFASMAAGVLAAPAAAELPDEIQVYDDGLNAPGKFGLELHLNHTIDGRITPDYPGDVPPGGATRITGEFSYGLGHGFEAGLYLDSVVDKTGKYYFAGPKLRLKWIGKAAPVTAERPGGWFYGLNVELGRLASRFDDARPSMEVRPILGWRSRDWLIAFNPILEFGFGGSEGATPAFSPAAKVARRVGDDVFLGLEAYRDVGSFGGFNRFGDQATYLFLTLDVGRGPLPFNFGIGRGFNGADSWTVKAIFELF
jgi:hypothetical protein